MQVDDELNDLHSGQVLLPLKTYENKTSVSAQAWMIIAQAANPYLGTTRRRVIVVVCGGK